VYYPYWLYTLY